MSHWIIWVFPSHERFNQRKNPGRLLGRADLPADRLPSVIDGDDVGWNWTDHYFDASRDARSEEVDAFLECARFAGASLPKQFIEGFVITRDSDPAIRWLVLIWWLATSETITDVRYISDPFATSLDVLDRIFQCPEACLDEMIPCDFTANDDRPALSNDMLMNCLAPVRQRFADRWSQCLNGSLILPPKRNRVSINPAQIMLDGTPYLLSTSEAMYLQALIDHDDWMSDSDFRKLHPEVGESARPDKWRKAMPDAIKAHLQTDRRRGTRWKE